MIDNETVQKPAAGTAGTGLGAWMARAAGDTRQGVITGFSFYGCNAWLDTCATESMTNPLISASGAAVKTYNCTFATDTYTPSSP